MKYLTVAAAFLGLTSAYYIGEKRDDSSTWTTLTPTATWSGGLTDYDTTFGIAIATIASSSSTAVAKRQYKRAELVSQIGDGQIQATTSTASSVTTAAVVSQISDGQIQATTSTAATTLTTATTTAAASTSDSDDDSVATSTTSSSSSSSTSTSDDYVDLVSCLTSSSLAMTLNKSILTDAKGRIGSIVANHQFQFDGPPPQAGAIYAAGWEITQDGYLAIGSNDVFYQCLSGTFYNLYDESIGDQCTAVHLEVVRLVSCS